ncbi:MAG: hypothetical protein DRG80_06460 [Deltaproteobacteria bacterium]|nr:MAG: hypothetical protein DRG80_06460 [Deltaproteobacteria bacterium]
MENSLPLFPGQLFLELVETIAHDLYQVCEDMVAHERIFFKKLDQVLFRNPYGLARPGGAIG